MTYWTEVHFWQFFHRLRCLLIISPEPSWCNSRICFRNCPLISVRETFCISAWRIAVDCILSLIYSRFRPCFLCRKSILISDPANCCISCRSEQHTVVIILTFNSFVFLDCVKPFFKVVFLISGAASFRTVHPYFFKMTFISVFLISKNLDQLVIIILIIILCILLFYLIPSQIINRAVCIRFSIIVCINKFH